MAKKGEKGSINLQGIFESITKEFMAAVEKGRILHASHNIRDSGAPLEASVREAFSKLLPSSFSIRHGFLFDTNSDCTPQIDIIISSSQRSHVMLRTPDGATYSPFSDAYAIGEIKASSSKAVDSLEQFSKQVQSLERMRRTLFNGRGFSHRSHDLISFLIFGDDSNLDLKKVADQWKRDPSGFPEYILLLKSGEIIIKPDGYMILFEELDRTVSPMQKPAGNELATWAAGKTIGEKRGNALLWFFYAILYGLRRCEAHDIASALAKIEQHEATVANNAKEAADIISRAADPFALAMTRSINLSKIKNLG